MASVANLPVTMLEMRALLPAKINGHDVKFMIDSGATQSFISPANADKFKLPRQQLPFGVTLSGAHGQIDAEVGVVKTLTLANTPIPDMGFVVGGADMGAGAVGLLGQNILGRWDVEYDLAKGSIQLWSVQGCSLTADMAYWAGTAPESVISLDSDGRRFGGQTKGPVYVNGARLTAIFDTGAPSTIMSRRGAALAGIGLNDPGVVSAGQGGGLGRGVFSRWIAPVKTFTIGDEEIRNTRMLFGDLELGDAADILVGADFFLAHHIFVSNQQRKLYLTYNGGPVFNLAPNSSPGPASPTTLATAAPPSPASATSETEPTEAGAFARRGAAFAARNDLDLAISDLSKAIDMAPAVADYRYQRGLVYARNQQPLLAKADFDETLKLKPDDVPALVARATLRLASHEPTQAMQDLDAADRATAKQDNVHLQLAGLYARADAPSASIAQYSLWIDFHEQDPRLADALNGRCWQRALAGVDLDQALNDCNRAIRSAPRTADMFDSRGLVHLRLGDLEKAIADYDAALALNPKLGWSLYGRGLAKQRKGLAAAGAADIAAAIAINPGLTDEMKKRGLTS
jgi:tetratricopeptide (TPR) repeat protein